MGGLGCKIWQCSLASTRLDVRLVLVTLILVGSTACSRDPVFTEMSDSTFVETMIALRKLPIGDTIDTLARNRSRDAILRSHGVTAEQVESTAVRLANDPERAAEVWRAIENPVPRQPPQKK